MTSAHPATLVVAWCSVCLLGVACDAGQAAAVPATANAATRAEEPIRLAVVSDRPLVEPELRWAQDVRWASDEAVWLAAARPGVFEVTLAGDRPPRRVVAAGGEAPDGSQLAASGGYLAAAAGFGVVSWTGLDPGVERATPLATIVDFDVWRGEAVFLGARRDEEGRWAPEGAVLWAGSLERGLEELTPRMYSASETNADEVALCGILELGAVRFFDDGRYIVVPGFQPGAYLYDRGGRLLRAWETGPLGFYDECDQSWDSSGLLARDPDARRRWVHQRVVLDDVVDWHGEPALLLRHPRPDGTTWRLVVLGDAGPSAPVELPVRTGSTASHVRADRRGDRLALVISEFGPEVPPAEPPRLVVLDVSTPSRNGTTQ